MSELTDLAERPGDKIVGCFVAYDSGASDRQYPIVKNGDGDGAIVRSGDAAGQETPANSDDDRRQPSK